MLQTGQKAPEFKLYNTFRKEISLAELRGKNVVLLFFPFAFTSTCTTELCTVRDGYEMYEKLNAVVFGVSTDSLFALGKFREEQKINFDLLSDYNKEVSEAYHSLYHSWGYGYKGVSKRSVFVIDAEGILRYSEILEDAGKLPDFAALTKSLEGLKQNA